MSGASKLWRSIRGWVDRTIRLPGLQAKLVLLPAFIPFPIIIFMENGLDLGRVNWTWMIGAGWLVAWYGLVAWRFWRHMKEAAIKSDRHYDRIGKYDLPAEYAETESAAGAKRRRKG